MQKPVAWIVGGLALTGLASMMSGGGDAAADTPAHLQLYLPALLVGGAGQFCLWRGLRSGIGSLWSGLWSGAARTAGHARSSQSDSEDDLPASDFDADAAFARYMERRSGESEAPDAAPAVTARPAANPAPRARAAARPAFGRKAV